MVFDLSFIICLTPVDALFYRPYPVFHCVNFLSFRMDDLEASLLMIDAQTASDVLRICKGKPINESLRPLAWQKCLDVSHSSYNAPLSEIFDLPEQKLLRHDCQQFVGMSNFNQYSTESNLFSAAQYKVFFIIFVYSSKTWE